MSFLDNWLVKKTPYSLRNLTKILQESYVKDRKQDEFIQKKSFSPSVIGYGNGQCPRYWNLAFNGAFFEYKHDAQAIENMRTGIDAHARIQDNFTNSDLNVECEKEVTFDNPPIRGFVDLIVSDFDGTDLVIEIKTTRSESFSFRKSKVQALDYHELQLLIYLYLLEKENGLVLYENKNDHEKVLIPVQLTQENKAKIEKVLAWMKNVYDTYKNGQTIKNPYRKNSKICSGCPIKTWCFEKSPEGVLDIKTLDKHLSDDSD